MNNQQLNRIEHLLERLDAAVVVRDPGNARAADAYDALRKQLNLTVKSHRSHVAHLLSLSDSLSRNASIELIQDRVNDFLAELGIKSIGVFINEYPDLFEIFETIEGSQDSYEVSEPAVVEELDGGGLNLIRQGKARQIRGLLTPNIVITSQPSEPSQQSEPELKSFSPFKSILLSGITLIIGLLLGIFVLSGKDDSSQNPVQTTVPLLVESTSTTISSATTTTVATTNSTEGS